MSEFVCTFSAQTELIDGHIKGKPSVRSVCCLAVEKYAPQSNFSCEKHMSSSRKRTIHFVVKTNYKDKLRVMKDKLRKDSVKPLKSRQWNKENWLSHSSSLDHYPYLSAFYTLFAHPISLSRSISLPTPFYLQHTAFY